MPTTIIIDFTIFHIYIFHLFYNGHVFFCNKEFYKKSEGGKVENQGLEYSFILWN